MRASLRVAIVLIPAAWASHSLGKLPAPTDAAKAQSGQAAAKAAWSDKVSQYQTCKVMDRVADAYRNDQKRAGKDAPAPVPTPPCADPGPYAASPVTPVQNKPIEASEAHSPTGNATSPPSTNATASELSKGTK